MTLFITRSGWQDPSNPITGSLSIPSEWRYNTIHWPGANVNVNNPVGVLRSMQSAWSRIKGYSLGYNFAVFPNGDVYVIRGFDIRCAANGDQEVNRPGIAILLVVPNVDTRPTNEMINGVRTVVSLTRARVPQTLIINAHRQIRPEPTACPGDEIAKMIVAGVFEPESELPIKEEDMGAEIKLIASDGTEFVWYPPMNTLRWVIDGNVSSAEPSISFIATYKGTLPNGNPVDDLIHALITNSVKVGIAPNGGKFLNAW
jgi:hypothetical protein